MWLWLLGICKALLAFFRSPSGKLVLKAVDGAIPIIRDINRRGFFSARRDADAARQAFDVLMQDPDFPAQFVKQREAYMEVRAMLRADQKFPDSEITASNIMKIVELAHGSFKQGQKQDG